MWDELTQEEQQAAHRAQGMSYAPGSPGWTAFGLRYDQAQAEGAQFELSASEMLAAVRLGMSPRVYASLLEVGNVDDYRRHERDEAVRHQALNELSVEKTKDELRGAA